MEQTQYRGFDPDLDARPVMHSQYIRPGEELLFAVGVSPANAAYDVRGRERDGSPKRFVLSALKTTLVTTTKVTAKLIEIYLRPYFTPELVRRRVVPVTVSGPRSDCRAASLADAARRKTGVWILTDRRFAFVEVRDDDRRETAPESTEDRLGLLKMDFDLPGKWSPDQENRQLGPVTTIPAFELSADRYWDRGRDRRKPKGSVEGVFHLLEFPDGSSIALGVDSPV
ncbi:hypothetical protein [Glycomyces sp. YM15]|uniref:hypothetical protein n=1 Tax=Glycomyces sp. YM15 TaxID=2800446 RepID=UPI0019656B7A|nr:hypothetical protein [Glycomyces sp. YM15]